MFRYFVWNETHYWKLDVRTMKTEVDYPRLISNIWKGMSSSISAAFTWSKGKILKILIKCVN